MNKRMGLLPALGLGLLLAAPGAWAQARRGGGMGTVSKVDAAAGTLEVTNRQGTARTYTVPASALILKQGTATAADLKAGDTIAVTGQPKQIDATTVEMGEMLTLGGPGGARAGGGQGGAGRGFGQGGAGRGFGFGQGRVRVQGSVSATSPNLTVKLEDGSTVQVNHTADTRFSRTTKGTLADVKSGDTVRVILEPGGDTVRAVVIGGPAPRAERAVRLPRRNRTAQAPATPVR
jgi:hypothetical protein